MKTKRIFVAIKISNNARSKVIKYIKTLKKEFPNLGVGWEKEEKLHITLKFLGDIKETQIKDLNKITEQIAAKFNSFILRLVENGVFPSRKKARVLFLNIEDNTGDLREIKANVENKLEKIGFKKEKRFFKPHLTIARLREPSKSKDLVTKHLENKFEPVEFEVSELVIFESELRPTGSIYKIISSFKLS